MTILKKKKYINLSIFKSGGWYNDSETEILEPTKVAIVRQNRRKCSLECIFSSLCNFWSPGYRLNGLVKEIKGTNMAKRLCRCCDTELDFEYSYIFTYENLIKDHVPSQILREMGLISDLPKKTKSTPESYSKQSSYRGSNKYSWMYITPLERIITQDENDYKKGGITRF